MEKENHIQFKTRGDSTNQGKPRVYFCCHPDDFDMYFEPVRNEILDKQNCAVYFYDNASSIPEQERETDLLSMQLFVIPVTTNLLTKPSIAMDKDFPLALKNKIPVLPLIQERGLEGLFARKFGDMQYLDKTQRDTTAISYEEKLEKHLSDILLGDEMTKKIKNEFDAYIFLSYRKADRKCAQELMRLIHKNKYYRDVAIWYDEFLTIGEDYRENIKETLQNSGLFVLVVTPNLLLPGSFGGVNYVMKEEYPTAKKTDVNVNGSIEKSRHDCMYADLVFRDLKDNDDTVRFTVIQDGASDENIDSIKHKNAVIINECLEPMLKEYDYVFVAAGNTETNRFIAETIAIEMLKENDKLCPVCYISEFSVDDDGTSNVYPVCINERITPETFSSDIDLVQMAFNADISWDNSLNKDMDEARDKFLNDRYRYESSLAFALSIRYKLYSIGLVLEKDAGTCNENAIVVKNLSEAANVFFEEILQKKDIDSEAGKCAKEKFDAVVALEHRRWVLEKVTAGWRAPRDKNGNLDLEQCVQKGKVKNELESTHPCIVYGTEETPLSTEEYNKYSESGREKWDVADIDPDLDELDLMSIKLHRCFRKRANEYKKNNPMQRESDIEKLRKLAEECGEDVSGAFRQYCFCLENILEGVENYTRQYSNYEKRLKKIFESSASEAVLKDAETRIALIKKAFFPVMEANLYRDYKSYDDVLVGKIPFILTYSFIEHVVVAFDESEEFNGRLNNVAAVTVLCPKKIDYIYYCDEHSDVDKVMTGLKAVLGYLDSREIHCQVRFVIAGSRECGTTNMLEKGLSGIESGKYQNVRFEGCTLLYCNPSQDAAYNEIVQYLQSDNCIYECSNLLFHDGKKYEAFKSVIKSAGIAYYSFDWRNKHFTKHNGCDYLQYIHDASFLTMENIAALKGTDSAISDIPEYQKDYEALWQIYESDKNAWRALCSCIDEYELRNKPLAQFEILGNECNEYTEKLSFVLPEYTEKTVRRLLRELSERDILRDDIIENYTSESYIVKFSVSKKYRHAFDTLFADPRILLDYYGVRAYNESKYVRVGYNNLEVVDISRIEENSYRMLEKLQDKHFINGLRREDSSDKVSFAFTSPRIKRVMMKTNRVLLLRAYYETLKYGYHEPNRIAYFDDVVYGSKIGNQDESDALFITKGFRHIKITDMGEWSDEQLACIGDTLNEKLRENNQ